MSQLVLDDQLDVQKIVPHLKGWITSIRLADLRPRQQILDDRVPEVLLTLKQATFVTIDHGFWNRSLCHPGYSILVFDLPTDQQHTLAHLLRQVLRLSAFRTRQRRMGKVARVQRDRITFWANRKRKSLKLDPADETPR